MKIITLCSTILSICAIRLKQTYSDLKFYKGIRDTNNSTCVYSENDNYIKYTVSTPIFREWVTEEDIEVHISNDHIIIKVLGSENYIHKLINENYIKENKTFNNHINNKLNDNDIMRKVNYGRDWEMWLNLKYKIQPNSIPIIDIKQREDCNSYIITVGISKASLELSDNSNIIKLSNNTIIT